MQRGKFISVEGGEGVGKSLFMGLLITKMKEQGITPLATREPGGTPSADYIREVFKHPPAGDPLVPLAELFLVSAARSQHVACKIAPALASGQWVLCDRFYDSTRVYQGAMAGIAAATFEPVIAVSVADTHPDLTLLLDCPVSVALGRIARRAEESGGAGAIRKDRYDSAESHTHEQLRQAYLEVSRRFPERIVVLDASGDAERLATEALSIMTTRWGEFHG